MAAKPCPNCKQPLEFPQFAVQVRCHHCGAIIRIKAAPAASNAAPHVTAGAPAPTVAAPIDPGPVSLPAAPPVAKPAQRGTLVLVGVVMGVLLLGCLSFAGVGSALWWFGGDEKNTPPEVVPEVVALAKPEPPPPPPPDPRIKIVQPSVDKGVAYIKTKVPQLASLRPAYSGLNGLTLLECGVPPDDPAILKIAENIRKAAPGMNQTYDLAASLFFLNRWHESRPLDEKDSKLVRTLGLRIIAGQLSNGIWGYGGVILTPVQETKLLSALEQGTYKPSGAATQSMSNTQFAMLAIWGSRKHGIPVRDPLLALAAYFHANQHPDGHWDYPFNGLAATSTLAGLISLAIEKALLQEKEFGARPRTPDNSKKTADVDKAFAFVTKTIGRKKGDPGGGTRYGGAIFNADAGGDLYFLWTLERVGVIYSKELIGGKDWYDWGYPIVMKVQLPDGSWNEPHNLGGGPLIDTPFALLFLKRANIARDLTEMIRPR